MRISERFPRLSAPGTGRRAIQLTAGPATSYPLYYFVSSLGKNGRHLVYHRYANKRVQLWRVDLETGEHVALTRSDFGYTHTGWDPEGRFWFWEQNNISRDKIRSGAASDSHTEGHTLAYLDRVVAGRETVFKPLFGNWPVDAGGQRAHFHPQLPPGGEWILFTGGDEELRLQLFLLDVSDLRSVNPIDPELLSADGRNDLHAAGIFEL